ncbi:MAG: hypothetical protein LBI12_01100, partial [Treponema sp.]|nr:hypothetical protein [Treponema sp.]
ETEFGGDPRLFDVMGSGLPLGLKIISPDEAAAVLGDNTDKKNPGNFNAGAQRRKGADLTEENLEKNKILLTKKTSDFIYGEKKYLTELRDILMGEAAAEQGRLNFLIDECDYLWAHFPDYAGGKRPDFAEGGREKLSFLKRVRTEIDFMLILMERQITDSE